MSGPRPDWQLVARRPRHAAATAADVQAWAAPHGQTQEAEQPVALVDVSRQGVQFCAPQPWPPRDVVCVRLAGPGGAAVTLPPATVRWARRSAEGWMLGCQFEEELAYEALGELFLLGVLQA